MDKPTRCVNCYEDFRPAMIQELKESGLPSPLVTVIVPLFNRIRFLPQLFATISGQDYPNLQLVFVDDGSTDGTADWVREHREELCHELVVLEQENQGPYAARNHALEYATGEYVTFQDSDDEWPFYHISRFVTALEANPDVDWIFGSIRRIDHETGKTVEPSNYVLKDGSRHPMLLLEHEKRNGVHVITDRNAVACAIEHRVPGSTQCMLARRRVFNQLRFDTSYRTAYDQFQLVRLFLYGFVVAWVEDVHQIYHVHDGHISLVAGGDPVKREESARVHIRGYEELMPELNSPSDQRALNKKLSTVWAWSLSIALRDQGRHSDEVAALWHAVKLYPTHLPYWKTAAAAVMRTVLRWSGIVALR